MRPLEIRFSHFYNKLKNFGEYADEAALIAVVPVNLEDLRADFLQYDTAHEKGCYPLPKKGKYLGLFFFSRGVPEGFVFTTLRRWTPSKEAYYRSNIGKEFIIVIEEAWS